MERNKIFERFNKNYLLDRPGSCWVVIISSFTIVFNTLRECFIFIPPASIRKPEVFRRYRIEHWREIG